MIGGKNGLVMSGRSIPSVLVRWRRRPRAITDGRYSSRSTAASTLRRVSGRSGRSLRWSARETVDGCTPARRATSRIVRRPVVPILLRKTFAASGPRLGRDHEPVKRVRRSCSMATLPRPLEQRGLELLGHTDLDGRGDGMQVMRSGEVLYVGHMGDFGIGTSVVDIADVTRPRVLRQIPVPRGTHSHKLQLANGLLLANHEQYPYRVGVPESAGLLVYDVSRDPRDPRRIGFLPVDGLGVHRIWWDGGRYAYASARERGFDARILIVVDLGDPERPRLASRWWWPGQRAGDPERLPESH